ncbi:MAG: LLM class F420-dependent oxidoreductase [Thermomicrobiales bacterium]
MRFGVHFAPTQEALDVRELGRLVEAAGFESLFFPEHTHLPAYGASIHPSGPALHDRLRRFLDPFIALTAVAGVTTRLRLGTGVCLVPEHDPITLAKQIATLDVLSGGRVLFGVGAGWNHEELRHHGTDPATRWQVLRERVLAMKQIWTMEVAEFHGQFVEFGPLWQWPKPVQRPHPPILVGGEGPRVLERVLEYGNEWAPNAEPGIAARVVALQRQAAALGRGNIPVTVMHVPPERRAIADYAAAGATRCVFSLPSADRATVTAALGQLGDLVAEYETSQADGQ